VEIKATWRSSFSLNYCSTVSDLFSRKKGAVYSSILIRSGKDKKFALNRFVVVANLFVGAANYKNKKKFKFSGYKYRKELNYL